MSREAFDNIWEEIHANYGWGKYPSENVVRFCARNYYKVQPRSSVKILDFGCGGGSNTWYFAREGFDTYAFDGSESAVKNAEKLLLSDGLRADFRVMDALKVDYEDSFFDVVVDNFCIECNIMENIKEMYKDCFRILKSGGKLFTAVFSTETKGFGTGVELEKNTFKDITEGRLVGRGVRHFWEKDELITVLSECGFENIRVNKHVYEDDGDLVGKYIVTGEKR